MSRRPAIALAAALGLGLAAQAGCASWRPETRPTSTRLVGLQYVDSGGLAVSTVSGEVAQPVVHGIDATASFTVDRIALPEGGEADDGVAEIRKPAIGDRVDATSSASTIAISQTESLADEWRYEGSLGLGHRASIDDRPVDVGVSVGGSVEADYRAAFAMARAGIELYERNLALAVFAGAGHDASMPIAEATLTRSAAATDAGRVFAGASVSQVLGPTALVSAGLALNLQSGELANPYRSADVRGVAVPEALPGERRRMTAFGQLAWHLGAGAALHARQGFYADSWGVAAIIPELALVRSVVADVRASLGYRLYLQRGADFYRPTYDHAMVYVSGDHRLGALRDHTASLDVAWRVRDDATVLIAGYAVSALTELDRARALLVSHVLHAGVRATF
jgi:hypothetical protein